MGKSTNQRCWDTHVATSRPDKNYGRMSRLGVWTNAPEGTSHAYVGFTRPFPLGAKILSAKLSFRTRGSMGTGSHTMLVRAVTQSFAFGRVTWNTRPTVAQGGSELTKSGALADGELWEIDITAQMEAVSEGRPWYGLRIHTTDAVARWIYSEDTLPDQKWGGPKVTIHWSDAPDEPASLSPDEGVVGTSKPAMSFEYLPIDEDAVLQAVHVQTSTSTSFAAPQWDSGQKPWTEPTVLPGDLGYPGAVVGQKTYWRIRVMDKGGWSGWSPIADFTYRPEPGLTMTAPVGGTAPIDGGDSVVLRGYITDSTPQISWESPGQVAYQVTVALETGSLAAKDWIWDSGVVKATSPTSIEIPKGVIRQDKVPYRIIVRAYDAYRRIAVSNDPYTYSGARAVVEFTDDPAMTKVTNVVGTQVPRTPTVRVAWKRASAADEYQIIRDGVSDVGRSRRVFADKVEHADVVQPDGTFAYIDHGAPPRTPYRYSIYPVTDGKRGVGTLGNVVETRLDGIWLVMPTFSLMIAGVEQGTWDLPEAVTAHEVIGAAAPTLIRDAHKGYQGSLSGTLVEEKVFQPGITGQMKKDRFLTIKDDPRGARLVIADLNIPVLLANLNVYPLHFPGDLRFACSFDFWQSGEMWQDRL